MEQWVTPGRFKVPHLQTTWSPSTMTWTINEVNTNPYNYPTLSVDSQAYKNIHEGIPTDFNQFEGCPVGHKMGPDGVCRPITGYIGPGLPEIELPVEPTPDPTPDPNDPFQENKYNYRGELQGQDTSWTDPHKDYMASVGTNKFYSTGNDYSALPGGMNNWTDEAFFDWGLDKGYITTSDIGGPMESKLKFGIFAGPAQFMNDKKFQWWFDSAQKRGILKASYDTEGELEGTELLKTRGEGDGFGGGGLINITKDTAESTWNKIVDTPLPLISVELGSDDKTTYPYEKREVGYTKSIPATFMKSIRNPEEAGLEIAFLNDWVQKEEARQDEWNATGYYTNEFGKKFGPSAEIGPERAKGLQKIKTYEEQVKDIENKLNEGFYDNLGDATKTQIYDPLLPDFKGGPGGGEYVKGGEFVDFDPGLDAEGRRRKRAKDLLYKNWLEDEKEANKIKPKEKPSFNIGTNIGNQAYNMSTAQTGQYIGASVYKSPDKASDVGGHYQQNGKFVNSNGQVSSRGSMSDSIYAMANGTAVDSVLDRTLKSKGSVNVMKKEAAKMLKAKKITQEEYNKVTSYNSKSDYQKDEKNLTIHENGKVVGGGTTGQSEGPAGSGSAGTSGGNQDKGNTGSGSNKKDKIICTEMYRQTNLNDWKEAMKLWYLFQKKHLTPTHQVGYHFLFKPFVRGMKKSKILTAIGSHFAKQRTKDIKHIMFGTKFSLLGRTYRIIFEPICYVTGLLLTYKEKLAWQ